MFGDALPDTCQGSPPRAAGADARDDDVVRSTHVCVDPLPNRGGDRRL